MPPRRHLRRADPGRKEGWLSWRREMECPWCHGETEVEIGVQCFHSEATKRPVDQFRNTPVGSPQARPEFAWSGV